MCVYIMYSTDLNCLRYNHQLRHKYQYNILRAYYYPVNDFVYNRNLWKTVQNIVFQNPRIDKNDKTQTNYL